MEKGICFSALTHENPQAIQEISFIFGKLLNLGLWKSCAIEIFLQTLLDVKDRQMVVYVTRKSGDYLGVF